MNPSGTVKRATVSFAILHFQRLALGLRRLRQLATAFICEFTVTPLSLLVIIISELVARPIEPLTAFLGRSEVFDHVKRVIGKLSDIVLEESR